MALTDQTAIRNRLLRAMQPADFARLRSNLTLRQYPARTLLIESRGPVVEVYFPETGLISFVSPGDVETEIGVVGHEGVVGTSVLLDVDRTPLRAMAQIPGQGFAMPASLLVEASEASRGLRRLLSHYIHVTMMQGASTSYANAHFSLEQRLARWLLMMHDRVEGNDLEVTHEFLSVMLGVRRPGVTVGTHLLEGQGLIRAKRGHITITDRARLEVLAGDSYGLAEAEYERLIGPRPASA